MINLKCLRHVGAQRFTTGRQTTCNMTRARLLPSVGAPMPALRNDFDKGVNSVTGVDFHTSRRRRKRARGKAAVLSFLAGAFFVASMMLLVLFADALFTDRHYEGRAWISAGFIVSAVTCAVFANLIGHWKNKILRAAGYGLQSILETADEVISSAPDCIEFVKSGRRVRVCKYRIAGPPYFQGQESIHQRTKILVSHDAEIPAVMEVGGFQRFSPSPVQLFDVKAYRAWRSTNPNELWRVPKKVRMSDQASMVKSDQIAAWLEGKSQDLLAHFHHGTELLRVEPGWVFCILRSPPEDLEPEFLAEGVCEQVHLAETMEVRR